MKVLYILGQDAGGLPHYTAELANAVADHAEVTVMKPRETTADDLFDDEVELVEAFRSLSVSMPEIYKRNVDPVEFARGVWSYNNLKRIAEIDADVTHVTTGLFPQTKLFGEARHVYSVLREEYPNVERPSIAETLWEIAESCYDQPNFEYLHLDDPGPFVRGLANALPVGR